MSNPTELLSLLVVAAIGAAARSSTSTETVPSTTAIVPISPISSTTTTAIAPVGLFDSINGLEADPAAIDRPAFAIKIDNHLAARLHQHGSTMVIQPSRLWASDSASNRDITWL